MNAKKCMMCGEPISNDRTVCYGCEDAEPSFNIVEIRVNLNKITDIAEFTGLASKCKEDVVVKSGRFAINAKSIMALYSLDLTKPLKVEFYGDIPYEVKEGMKKFIVN